MPGPHLKLSWCGRAAGGFPLAWAGRVCVTFQDTGPATDHTMGQQSGRISYQGKEGHSVQKLDTEMEDSVARPVLLEATLVEVMSVLDGGGQRLHVPSSQSAVGCHSVLHPREGKWTFPGCSWPSPSAAHCSPCWVTPRQGTAAWPLTMTTGIGAEEGVLGPRF